MADSARKRIYISGSKLAGLETSLEASLQTHKPLIHHFSDHRQCLRELCKNPCDLLIIDVEACPEEITRIVMQAKSQVPWMDVLALVDKGAVACAVQMMKAGACDCLETSRGEKHLCQTVKRHIKHVRTNATHQYRPLTEIEAKVLRLVLAGKTSSQIAAELHRSKRTIDVHRKNLLRKLGASGPLDLVRRALELGTGQWLGKQNLPDNAI